MGKTTKDWPAKVKRENQMNGCGEIANCEKIKYMYDQNEGE